MVCGPYGGDSRIETIERNLSRRPFEESDDLETWAIFSIEILQTLWVVFSMVL